MSSVTVSELVIYPLKSAGGIALETLSIADRGPVNDRRWMLVNTDNEFITQRQYPRMCFIETLLNISGDLILNANGVDGIQIQLPVDYDQRCVQVWGDSVDALDCGDEAAAWISDFLGVNCRLVYMPDSARRMVDQVYAGNDEIVSFSDGFPLLLVSQASLDDLNSRLNKPILMNRFRPNIVVQGCDAYAEDQWQTIRLGELEFEVVKPCSRCVIPSIDPESGEKQAEVLRVLAKYRQHEGRIYFGQNLLHKKHGEITLNDPVQIVR